MYYIYIYIYILLNLPEQTEALPPTTHEGADIEQHSLIMGCNMP